MLKRAEQIEGQHRRFMRIDGSVDELAVLVGEHDLSLAENAKEPPVGQIPENARHPAPARDHRRHIGGWHEEGPSRGGREERLLEELLHVGIGEPRTPDHRVRPGTKGVEPACLIGRNRQLRRIWGVSDRRWCGRWGRWGSARAGAQRRRKMGEAPCGEPKGRRKIDFSDESDRRLQGRNLVTAGLRLRVARSGGTDTRPDLLCELRYRLARRTGPFLPPRSPADRDTAGTTDRHSITSVGECQRASALIAATPSFLGVRLPQRDLQVRYLCPPNVWFSSKPRKQAERPAGDALRSVGACLLQPRVGLHLHGMARLCIIPPLPMACRSRRARAGEPSEGRAFGAEAC